MARIIEVFHDLKRLRGGQRLVSFGDKVGYVNTGPGNWSVILPDSEPRRLPPREAESLLRPRFLMKKTEVDHCTKNFGVFGRALHNKLFAGLEMERDRVALIEILTGLNDVGASALLKSIDAINKALETWDVSAILELRRYPRVQIDKTSLSCGERAVLELFSSSVKLMEQCPDLTGFAVDNPRTCAADVRRAGAQIAQYMKSHNCGGNPLSAKHGFEFVAYEAKPLHLSTPFRWLCSGESDPRLLSIDVIGAFEGRPMWIEVKSADDSTWPIAQLLTYGAVMSSTNQRSRLNEYPLGTPFGEVNHPWLGLVVEGNEELLPHALEFFGKGEVKRRLASHFSGFIGYQIVRNNGGWVSKDDWKVTFYTD